jgi:hypothetical protein
MKGIVESKYEKPATSGHEMFHAQGYDAACYFRTSAMSEAVDYSYNCSSSYRTIASSAYSGREHHVGYGDSRYLSVTGSATSGHVSGYQRESVAWDIRGSAYYGEETLYREMSDSHRFHGRYAMSGYEMYHGNASDRFMWVNNSATDGKMGGYTMQSYCHSLASSANSGFFHTVEYAHDGFMVFRN